MKNLANILESKRSVAGLFILAGLVFTTYTVQENSGQIKKLSNFETGIQTCFTRVNQTYTANLLGDTASTYLTQNFQNLTEECLAEGILTIENSFQKELSSAAKQLSNLASNVHWFHEDILAPAPTKGLAQNAEARDVGARFEKIETTKDEILETTSRYKTQVTNSLNQQKNLFYVSATLLVILMLAEYMSLTRRRLSNNAREKEAQAELIDNGGATSVKVGEIIRVALEQNDLVNCSKLFANFHAYTTLEKGKNKVSLETLVTPLGPVKTQQAAQVTQSIEQAWEDDTIGVSVDDTSRAAMSIAATTTNQIQLENINLEQMSGSVIDLLAEKLFSQGVKLNVNVPENLMIQGKNEELEQSLYHLFTYAINSSAGSSSNEKNISVIAHRLGDIVAFDVTHAGSGFNSNLLKLRHGMGEAGASGSGLDLDLQIAQALLTEVGAKIQLDNTIDQGGNISGGRIKIIFKTGALKTVENGRLVDLKVGSKKDILASMNS